MRKACSSDTGDARDGREKGWEPSDAVSGKVFPSGKEEALMWGVFLRKKGIGIHPPWTSTGSESVRELRIQDYSQLRAAEHDQARGPEIAGDGGFWPGSSFVQTHRGSEPIPDVEAV
jgi:hypothetical protein